MQKRRSDILILARRAEPGVVAGGTGLTHIRDLDLDIAVLDTWPHDPALPLYGLIQKGVTVNESDGNACKYNILLRAIYLGNITQPSLLRNEDNAVLGAWPWQDANSIVAWQIPFHIYLESSLSDNAVRFLVAGSVHGAIPPQGFCVRHWASTTGEVKPVAEGDQLYDPDSNRKVKQRGIL
ncbi:hypothetical protein J6590_008752 [Homalodisca vitripennis]|nr:hypothetical protein J6590_008752 [Homalodisca vitripennis]